MKKENIKDKLPIFVTYKLEPFWRIEIQIKQLQQIPLMKITPEFEKINCLRKELSKSA